jgi:large subunit ribosomal protein L13e
MPAHNNSIQRPHLRKHYAKWIKTWFNQPARKNRRLQKRKEKAASIFPRPLSALRPVVHKTTARYSGQPRLGRGFTLEEIKKAGLNASFARTIGIAVDHRRTNKSVESVQRNVNRLKAFIEKLVLLPKTAGKPKKGRNGVLSDSTETPQLVQNTDKAVFGKPEIKLREKRVAITKEMQQFHAFRQLRLERTNQKWAGKRSLKTETAKE